MRLATSCTPEIRYPYLALSPFVQVFRAVGRLRDGRRSSRTIPRCSYLLKSQLLLTCSPEIPAWLNSAETVVRTRPYHKT